MPLIHQTSTQTRRLVGSMNSSESLIEQLTALCVEHNVRAAQVKISGALSGLTLARFSGKSGEYETVLDHKGPAEVVHAHGYVAQMGGAVILRIEGLFSVDAPNGPQLVSGQLTEAHAQACEFVVETFEGLIFKWGVDAKTRRVILQKVERDALAPDVVEVAKPAPVKPVAAAKPAAVAVKKPAAVAPTPEPVKAKASWDDVMGSGNETEERKSRRPIPQQAQVPSANEIYADWEDDFPEMSPGDILQHPKFGPCRIIRIENEEFAYIRLPRGKPSKLMLDLFVIEPIGEKEGKRVFKLKRR